MNKVSLIGWVSQQPEIHVDTSGTLQCSTMVALERSGNVPDVVTIIASGKNAERLADFSRGDQIGITGSLKTAIHKVQIEKYVIDTSVMVESIDLSKKQHSPLDDEFLPEILKLEK